jgi:hypothetical protein
MHCLNFYIVVPQCEFPNVVVEWLTLLFRILEVPGSNLILETGRPDSVFRGFPQSLEANAGRVY